MIEVFKIIHNIYDAKVSHQLILNERANSRGNNCKFLTILFITIYKNTFFPAHIVNIWNSLPNSVIEACSINAFKAHLDKIWSHQEFKFDFITNLTGIGN